MTEAVTTGYAPVNGMELYWESRGAGGTPLVVVHGGFGLTSMFGGLLDRLAERRQVIAIELQGHGHTRDIDRPFSYQAFGDDVAAVVEQVAGGRADLFGYSLGSGACLRAAIQHPERVRQLGLVSTSVRRDDSYPEVLAAMAQVNSGGFDMVKQTPMYAAWRAVAPDVESFPVLMDKTGALLQRPFDWSEDVRRLTMPTLLVYGDADSISPARAVANFALLGGGQADAGWDGSLPTPHRLAILPGASHYDILGAPTLGAVVDSFFS